MKRSIHYHDKQPREHKPSRRCHYNRHGRAKVAFTDRADAEAFILEHSLTGYVAYRCRVCSLWHIGRIERFND